MDNDSAYGDSEYVLKCPVELRQTRQFADNKHLVKQARELRFLAILWAIGKQDILLYIMALLLILPREEVHSLHAFH